MAATNAAVGASVVVGSHYLTVSDSTATTHGWQQRESLHLIAALLYGLSGLHIVWYGMT